MSEKGEGVEDVPAGKVRMGEGVLELLLLPRVKEPRVVCVVQWRPKVKGCSRLASEDEVALKPTVLRYRSSVMSCLLRSDVQGVPVVLPGTQMETVKGGWVSNESRVLLTWVLFEL